MKYILLKQVENIESSSQTNILVKILHENKPNSQQIYKPGNTGLEYPKTCESLFNVQQQKTSTFNTLSMFQKTAYVI